MPRNVVMKTIIKFLNLRLYAIQSTETFLVLRSVALIQTVKPPHHRTADNCDHNGNPPIHPSHPTASNRLSLDASICRLLDLQLLTLLDRWTVEIIFAVSETQADRLYMASKANSTSARQTVGKLNFSAMNT